MVAREGYLYAEMYTIDPDGLGEALVVFGFEEEAQMFLGLEEVDTGWQARETTAGELVSVLYGPCASIDRVAIDLLPQKIAGRTGIRPLCVSSTDFTRTMVDAGGAGAGAMPTLATLRP